MSSVKITIIVVVLVLGVGLGWWLIAPYFYDTEVNEDLPGAVTQLTGSTHTVPPSATTQQPASGGSAQAPAETPPAAGVVTVRQGAFAGADSFHQGSGTARIVEVDGKQYVRFEEDFSVTNGPDLFVHFGNGGTYDAAANLGRLKGSVGSQNYEIPSDIDASQYSEVWVWCRAFSVPFASAQLQ